MSETKKYIVMLHLTQPFLHDNLDNYTTSMLKSGYHAAWSSLMKRLGKRERAHKRQSSRVRGPRHRRSQPTLHLERRALRIRPTGRCGSELQHHKDGP